MSEADHNKDSDKLHIAEDRIAQEVKLQRLFTALTKLAAESPPEDPPRHAGQGRGEHYDRGRQETWEWFEAGLLALLKEHGAFGASAPKEEAKDD